MISSSKYYSEKLSARRLRRCYEIAPPRVQQYLAAEIAHALERIGVRDCVLELGCGYGRALERFAGKAKLACGIDAARDSLALGKELMRSFSNCHYFQMNAAELAFASGLFDVTIGIQNGLSAFKVDPLDLMRESLRVTKTGGIVIFSSYSDKFWQQRLDWFRLQAEQGLLGEIDEEYSGNGVIVCKDGFRATTFRAADFLELAHQLERQAQILEIDESSVFCEINA